ncbi:MAG: GNAT family N-acetyltransferase [Candidatus Cloacimonetes bacterium 4572_55]|nr:MAG: GNAT family N-acetyltransferase [Candidatus Cloacimonetes bacterium 4572_55]
MEQKIIYTERLLLRPFTLDDAPRVRQLAGEWEIADTTTNIPNPYEKGMGEEWILTHQPDFKQNKAVTFAVVLRMNDQLVGAISLLLKNPHDAAEMGYWIGKPYWRRGYCSEAAMAMLEYGFGTIGLNRIYAEYFKRNPASGKVMEKIGMSYEGRLRQNIKKWDAYEDMMIFGILKAEYKKNR